MFTTIQGQKINPVDYIKEYMRTHDNVQLFIGCDSQNTKETTTYVTAIVLYSQGHGGHIIYEKERTPKEKVRSIRLMNEVWKSVSIANDLVEAGVKKPDYIDIDVNPNSRYKSNEVFNAAVGIVEAYGYKCRYKTLGQIATWGADFLVRS
jgi:predicted RNase H-related nuclease YkuK (DUF458 family)